MPIANEIAFDMLAVYFECMQNAIIAARMYAIRYPDRRGAAIINEFLFDWRNA